MQNYNKNFNIYTAILESISIISSSTSNKSKEYLNYLKIQIECLIISNQVAEKDYKMLKMLIRKYFRLFKQYHSHSTNKLILKSMVDEEIKKLNQNINQILKNCDKKYLNKFKNYQKEM